MATAYFYFGKPVNPDSVNGLIMGTRTFMGEKDPQGQFLWDTFQIAYASGGGDVIAAMGLRSSSTKSNGILLAALGFKLPL